MAKQGSAGTELCLAGVTPRVRVLPMVYFAILDHFARRPAEQTRVIGTLLGTVSGSTVEVTNSYAVPHSEDNDVVKVDLEHNTTMSELHQRINPNERIVGWYATSPDVNEFSVLIHDFYARDAIVSPVHLCIDPSLKNGRISIRAFVSQSMGAPSGTVGSLFVPIECALYRDPTERIARWSTWGCLLFRCLCVDLFILLLFFFLVARSPVEALSSTLNSPQRNAPLRTDLEVCSVWRVFFFLKKKRRRRRKRRRKRKGCRRKLTALL